MALITISKEPSNPHRYRKFQLAVTATVVGFSRGKRIYSKRPTLTGIGTAIQKALEQIFHINDAVIDIYDNVVVIVLNYAEWDTSAEDVIASIIIRHIGITEEIRVVRT